jgi:hypothetical protein
MYKIGFALRGVITKSLFSLNLINRNYMKLKIPSMSFKTLSASIVLASSCFAGLNQPPEGYTAIFNGKNLDGWWGLKTEDPAKWMALSPEDFAKKKAASLEDIKQHWTVKDGVLVNDGHGLYLSTEKNYGDFDLYVDYKTVARADSGIYLRGVPQVQIWDFTKEGGKWNIGADKGSGGLWNNGPAGTPGRDPLVLADKPFGEWNSFKITMVGDIVTVILNDKLVVDKAPLANFWDRKSPVDKRKPLIAKGPIQLQTHGGEISWRNIFIKELDKGSKGPDGDKGAADTECGFDSIFNGKDLTGWAGAVDNYEVEDGAIKCKQGKGGNLYTEEKYQDFVVRFEFKLPPGGNNGLAIRYPGQGNPAYSGMTELQVLDNTHPKYAKLDKRQYHGSAYGMVAAERGYLKKPGEWNNQEVTVKGSTIKVILNGTEILNADLKDVKEYMGGKPHPGKDIKEGHFGFAGHSDPVMFRNLRIKKL